MPVLVSQSSSIAGAAKAFKVYSRGWLCVVSGQEQFGFVKYSGF